MKNHRISRLAATLGIIMLLALFTAPQLLAWEHEGDLIIKSQSELDALQYSLKKITGDLIILGSDVKDLNKLYKLHTIGGNFKIGDNVSFDDLAPLEAIKTVGGEIIIKEKSLPINKDQIPENMREILRHRQIIK